MTASPSAGPARGRPAPPDGAGERLTIQHVRHGREHGVPVQVAGVDGHPVLERVVERRRDAVLHAVGRAVADASLLIVTGGLYLVLGGAGSVTTAAVVGVLAILVGALAVRIHRASRVRTVEAGARAVAVVDGRGAGPWVEIDRLADVGLSTDRQGPVLRLRDRDGRRLALPCAPLEAGPELMALVRAGVASSAAAGARVDPRVRRRLALPPP